MGEAAVNQSYVPGVRFRFRAELAEFFTTYEASIGYRSTFGAMLAADAGVELGAGPPADWTPYEHVVSWTDGSAVSRGRRVWATLQRLQAARGALPLVVLHLLNGERAPSFLGFEECPRCASEDGHTANCDVVEFGPILHLTMAAERAREDLACDRGEERESETRLRVATAPEKAGERFWHLSTLLQAALTKRAAMKAAKARGEVVDGAKALAHEIVELRRVLFEAMETSQESDAVELPAVYSILAGADAETTARDALRWRLDAHAADTRFRASGLRGAALKAANAQWRHDSDAFVRAAVRDAVALRDGAEAAYVVARGEA